MTFCNTNVLEIVKKSEILHTTFFSNILPYPVDLLMTPFKLCTNNRKYVGLHPAKFRQNRLSLSTSKYRWFINAAHFIVASYNFKNARRLYNFILVKRTPSNCESPVILTSISHKFRLALKSNIHDVFMLENAVIVFYCSKMGVKIPLGWHLQHDSRNQSNLPDSARFAGDYWFILRHLTLIYSCIKVNVRWIGLSYSMSSKWVG